MGLRALYGGRYLRTTMVLAATGVAAGAVTGAVGLDLAGSHGSHDPSVGGQRPASVKHHRHVRPSPHLTFMFSHQPTPSPTRRSPSATPTPTRRVSPTPTPAATSAPPTTPAPSAGSSSANSTGAPQSEPTG